jgi:hypothetical protein
MIVHNEEAWRKRILISTPTEGWVRFEWSHARYGQIIPVNWACGGYSVNYSKNGYHPLGYSIDDAYNLIAWFALEKQMEWLLIIEDDVIIPTYCFLKMTEYIDNGKIPVVSGLYFTKGDSFFTPSIQRQG